jgi:predicted flap endonuclease-1-like 5' DNA nuclease
MVPNLFEKACRGSLCRLCWPAGLQTWPAGEKSGEDAMNKEMKELQKLKGIGEVLARRLIEASYNTIAKVAAAEEHWLKKIPGMNPHKVRSIVTQARELTSEAEKNRPKAWKH